jgi:hypothetical protein
MNLSKPSASPARVPTASPSITFTGFPISTGHKAHIALTAVPSRGIEALAIATEIQVLRALVKVCRQKEHKSLFFS